jgi:hypothetical protein
LKERRISRKRVSKKAKPDKKKITYYEAWPRH